MKVEKVYARNLRVAQNRAIGYPRGATNIKFILHRRLGAEKALKCARNHANWHVKDVDRRSSARRRFGSSLYIARLQVKLPPQTCLFTRQMVDATGAPFSQSVYSRYLII